MCPGQRDNPPGKAVETWPGMPHECPANSDAHGLSAQATCTCLPGYHGGVVTDLACKCSLCPPGFFCPDGGAPVACVRCASSPPGSTSLEQCVCVASSYLLLLLANKMNWLEH
jgi:hypothetical protein